MTPAEVCEKLGIQPSTLRKYSLLFEKEQIVFSRNKNNSRNYTVMQFEALQDALELAKDPDMTLETALKQASKRLKTETVITPENNITPITPQRYDGDITVAMLDEIKHLREELRRSEERQLEQDKRQKERDSMFVEALEGLYKEITELKALQQPPVDVEINEQSPKEKDVVLTDTPQKKKGFFSRFFK